MRLALLTTLAFLLMSCGTYAQEQQVGFKASMAVTEGTGHSIPVGAEMEAVIAVAKRFKIVSSGGAWKEAKIETGDGHAFRAKAEGRFYLAPSYFVSGGGYYVQQSTSRWNKTAFAPTLGGGFNLNDRIILSYAHRLKERQTLNRVSGDVFSADFYQPASGRWLVRFGLSYQRVSFVQFSTGDRKYTGHSVILYLGAARLFGERK